MNLKLTYSQFNELYPKNRFFSPKAHGTAFSLIEPIGPHAVFHYFLRDDFYIYPVFKTRDPNFGIQILELEKYWKMAFPHTKYETIWNYENKVILLEKATGNYYFFNIKDTFPNRSYSTIIIVGPEDFKTGREIAEGVWNPVPQVKKIDFQKMALDHIESMVWSMIKRENYEKLMKADFAFIYYNNGEWHAFYPPVEDLIVHHESKEEQYPGYIDYLKSVEFKALRSKWDSSPNVSVPQQ